MAHQGGLPLPPSPNGKEVLQPWTREGWRTWLEARPDRSEGVWVAYPNKSSGLDGPGYEDLVEEALCFGWIDSVTRSVGDGRALQWFSPRRKGGVWSGPNKERIKRLVAQGSMTERGRVAINSAKADGSWSQYDDVEALVIHPDLEEAFEAAPAAWEAFNATASSTRKQHLWWVYSAKRPDTRANRIAELIERLEGDG